ncbi:hypothetical protein KR767_04105 [Luteibacter anthropi]|uniref:phage major capsid protein n=1 Tax=Luteibacter anthropi TaxID=564369 RepID=UPI002032D3A3|nr:hypothetical protein [Luteibacter anthropi]URX63260.1 hypothetical protein KR767_04105 [Luteibacter anthropi]
MKRTRLSSSIAALLATGLVPTAGIVGQNALREAAATEFGQVRDLLQAALRANYGLSDTDWVCIEAIYPDRVVVERDGKNYEFTYAIDDANNVTLGAAVEVVITTTPVTDTTVREAAATDAEARQRLVFSAIRKVNPDVWNFVAVYPDNVVITSGNNGRQYAYPYTIDDSNQVTVGTPYEVVSTHVPASSATPLRESAATNKPTAAGAAGGGTKTNNATALHGDVFIEAVGDDDKPSRYLVRVIRAGTSLNNVTYPREVLREAAPLFDGVRVFVKSDAEHIKGGGKDFRQLVGKLSDPKFIEAGSGEIQATLDVLESSDVAAKLREAVARDMTDLFGLSIDASGKSKKSGRFREAISLTKVDSVDLIIEPGAGGQFIRFAEAHQESDTMLREQMISQIRARDAKRADALANASDDDVLTAYREAVGSPGTGLTEDQLEARLRMVEARASARTLIAGSRLPAVAQERLTTRFAEAASFSEDDVRKAIEDERTYLGRFAEGAQVRGLGMQIEMGEGRAEKMAAMLDDFFDRSKPSMSFKECYIELTGDAKVTGLVRNMDESRLREAAGDRVFREAINSGTFADILGDSITRAMIRQYANLPGWSDWRWLCDIVPVSDFRTQERTRIGGFGDLPDVAQGAPYNELNPPDDEAASYAASKRGGLQTITLEAIANDDVGLFRRMPTMLATSAARTLYKFVYGFLDANRAIYDGKALFHADHANLGTAALAAASFSAARLSMFQQAEMSSGERLGIPLRHLAIPGDLQQAAYDLFQRSTNLDKTFVQSQDPTVHVVTHWTDANNWFATADNADVPLIELGFYNGQEDPELFVQDQPTAGSVFTNDKITYKIRHIYGGAVRDYRGFYGAIVA